MTQESNRPGEANVGNVERLEPAQRYFDKAISLINPTDSASPHEFLHIAEAQIDAGLQPVMTPDEIYSHRSNTRVTASGFDGNLAVLTAKYGDGDKAMERASRVIQYALVGLRESEMKEVMTMSEQLSRILKNPGELRSIALSSEGILKVYFGLKTHRIGWTECSLVVDAAKTADRAGHDPFAILNDLGGLILQTDRSQGKFGSDWDYGHSAQRLAVGHAELGDFEGALELAGTINRYDSISAHDFVKAHAAIAIEQAKRVIDPQKTIDIFLPIVPKLQPTLLGNEHGDTRKQEKAFQNAAIAEIIYRGNPYNYLSEARTIVGNMPQDNHFTKIDALIDLARTEGVIDGRQTARRTLEKAKKILEQMDPMNVSAFEAIDMPNRYVDIANAATDTANFDIAEKLLGRELGEDDVPPTDTRGVDLRIPAYAKLGAALIRN